MAIHLPSTLPFSPNGSEALATRDQLIESAEQVARQLAALPPLSVRAMKRVMNETASSNIRTALDRETRATITGFMDPETTRLLQAF